MNDNAPYPIDGLLVDGRAWFGWQIESRADIYGVIVHPDRGTLYRHNYLDVPALPNTPLVRRLLAHVAALQAMSVEG